MANEEKGGLISVKDLAGVSAPLTKLAETIGAAIGQTLGGVGKIIHTFLLANKEARNEAERIDLIEGAKTRAMAQRAQALASLAGGNSPRVQAISVNADGTVAAQLTGTQDEELSLNQRAEQRMAYQNAMQQLNIEAVVTLAAEDLSGEEQVAEEPVRLDWTTRFFNIAQDVSEKEVQVLLGKILAGEVKSPSSFSLRTLEVLRNLSKEEAEIFIQVCECISDTLQESAKQSLHIINAGMDEAANDFLDKYINYSKILDLADCGLVNGLNGSIGFEADSEEGGYFNYFRVGRTLLLAEMPHARYPISVSEHSLTKAGAELYSLLNPAGNLNYIIDLGVMLEGEGFKVSYTKYRDNAEDINDYEEPFRDFAELREIYNSAE